MKNKKSTLQSVLLGAMIFTSAFQISYGQLPPRLIAYTEYGFDNGAFSAADSTFFRYDQPNSYSQRLKQWLPGVMANRLLDINTGLLTEPDDSTIYAYDNNGNNTAIIEMEYDGNGWDTSTQMFFTYNSNNLVTKQVHMDNVHSTPKWRTFETTYTYDGQNNLIEEVVQVTDFFSGVGQNSSRTVYGYSAGLRTSQTLYDWNNNQWNLSERTNYRYKNGIADSIWLEFYDQSIPGFRNSRLEVRHLNSNNDADTITTYDWRSTEWREWQRSVLIYNGNRNIVQSIAQSANVGSWENESSDSVYYNSDQLPSVRVFNQQWDNANGRFGNKDLETYMKTYYYDKTSNVPETDKRANAISVFPNPAKDYVTIQYSNASSSPLSVTVYNTTGKEVRHWNEKAGTHFTKTMDVSSLPQGQYIIRIGVDKLAYQRFTVIH